MLSKGFKENTKSNNKAKNISSKTDDILENISNKSTTTDTKTIDNKSNDITDNINNQSQKLSSTISKGNGQGKNSNIKNKPVEDWSDEDVQRAVDSIHNSVYGKDGIYPGKGGANPYSLIVTKDGKVVLSSNNQYPTGATQKMNEIFGEGNYTLVDGTTRTNYKVPEGATLTEGGYVNHAEPRAIQKVKDMDGSVENAREACSHLSCESCTEIMNYEKVKNITGSVNPDTKGKRGRYKREYLDNLF